jgi:hypothetical protein
MSIGLPLFITKFGNKSTSSFEKTTLITNFGHQFTYVHKEKHSQLDHIHGSNTSQSDKENIDNESG